MKVHEEQRMLPCSAAIPRGVSRLAPALVLVLISAGPGHGQCELTKFVGDDTMLGDQFGGATALRGETLAVGARDDDDAGPSSGSVYVFERNAGGPEAWAQVAKLTASDADAFDEFGIRVVMDADTLVIGAPGNDDAGSGSGSAYVFTRSQGAGGAWAEAAVLVASDADEGDNFGNAVSIHGDVAVIGSKRDDDGGASSGSAYVYERDLGGADAWGEAAKLVAPDAERLDQFGTAVAIWGDTAIVGAWGEDEAGTNAGAAYVFERDAGGPGNWGFVRKIIADGAGNGTSLGTDMAMEQDRILIAAQFDDPGHVYIFERDAGGPGQWGQVAMLTASDGGVNDGFGSGVDIAGDRVVVGAALIAESAGAAYVFHRDAGGPGAWGEVAVLTASDGEPGAEYGNAVSVHDDVIVVGALLDSGLQTWAGAAYVYVDSCGCSGDLDDDAFIGVEDLIALVLGWGPCGPACPADLDGDGFVGVADLVALVLSWGPCPP